MPPAPRFPRSMTEDRFRAEPSFGDELHVEDTRPLPNIVFQNGHALKARSSGDHGELSPRLQLPEVIHFYVRLKFQKVSFPFPAGISTKQYLHKATLVSTGEAHVNLAFNPKTVIGLEKFMMSTFAQLVIEIPSTNRVNPTVHPTRLSFHPRHSACLHRGTTGGSERSSALPRINVTVWPHQISRPKAAGRDDRAPPPRAPNIWGTFGSSDGRFGPAIPDMEGAWNRAAAIVAAADARRAAALAAATGPNRPKSARRSRQSASKATAAPKRVAWTAEDDIMASIGLADSVIMGEIEAAAAALNAMPGTEPAAAPARVMRPSFLLA